MPHALICLAGELGGESAWINPRHIYEQVADAADDTALTADGDPVARIAARCSNCLRCASSNRSG